MLSELEHLVRSYEEGGSKYFSLSNFLMGTKLPILQQLDPKLSEEGAEWINEVGFGLDDEDIFEIGVHLLENLNGEYWTELSLVASLSDTYGKRGWQQFGPYVRNLVRRNAVPYTPLFSYLTVEEPDTRPVVGEDGWIEVNALKYGLSCSNFEAAQEIIALAWAILDPSDFPYRYVVPKAEEHVFVRNIVSIIDRSDKSQQEATYRELKLLGKERERIQDDRMRESVEFPAF